MSTHRTTKRAVVAAARNLVKATAQEAAAEIAARKLSSIAGRAVMMEPHRNRRYMAEGDYEIQISLMSPEQLLRWLTR